MPNTPMRFFQALVPIGALALVSVTARVASLGNGPPPNTADETLSRLSIRSEVADARTQKSLENVVAGQLAAIRRNDMKAAMSYYVAGSQERSGPERFAEMMYYRWPHIAAPRDAEYRPARHSRSTASMSVRVTAQDGTDAIYIFNFRRDPQNWRVHSVIPTVPPEHYAQFR